MKDLKCFIHGTALTGKEVPVAYGMPTPDSDIFEIGSRFPYHGLWSLGGCEVSDDSPENGIDLVCSDCHDAAQKHVSGDWEPIPCRLGMPEWWLGQL